jgi:hypothetical protein
MYTCVFSRSVRPPEEPLALLHLNPAPLRSAVPGQFRRAKKLWAGVGHKPDQKYHMVWRRVVVVVLLRRTADGWTGQFVDYRTHAVSGQREERLPVPATALTILLLR